MTYFKNIKEAATTLSKGLSLTFRHMVEARRSSKPVPVSEDGYFDEHEKGISTLQYPHETIPVPDNGRYRLHNEIDDCIVCDKCAKICPVDCIDIEGIKATDVIGKTSDGTPKRIHAARFDIDMSKCCFCGLCTTVCPTECLTMTKAYDFSEYDFRDHTYSFATMTPLEILEKRKELEEFENEKNREKSEKDNETGKQSGLKPRPKVKLQPTSEENEAKPVAKPVFKPKIKTSSRPVIKPKPVMKPQPPTGDTGTKPEEKPAAKPGIKASPRPVIKPKSDMKPAQPPKKKNEGDD